MKHQTYIYHQNAKFNESEVIGLEAGSKNRKKILD